ncbi:MATE family efflux transporter [Luminiphilus sp.]|nr:MATE family efflux transporter [Luminiphilus sp.]
MDDRTQYLLTARPLPLLAGLSAPNSIAFFIQASVSMTEVWFVGQLGSSSLAAMALVFPLLMLTQTLSAGAMGGAVASAIARALGAGDQRRAEQLIWHALALAVIGALLLFTLFRAFGEPFLRFLGGNSGTLTEALRYCLVLFSGGVFLWFMGVVSAIYRGMGDMKFPALIMAASALVQVPLSAALVLGAFGAPQLGIVGAAVSAVVTAFLLSGIMLLRLIIGNTAIKIRRSHFGFEYQHFREILNVALPASLSPILTVTSILCLTAIVGRFGEEALAGYGIGSRIEFLLIPLVFGIGASMTSLVGMSVGAGDLKRAEHIGWVGGMGSALLAGIIGISLAVFPDFWIPLFSQNPIVQGAAKQYIQIVGPCFAFQGLGLSLYFASQGAGAMFWPVVSLVLRLIVAVGGALLLINTTDWGLAGVFYAAAFGMAIYGIIMVSALKLGAFRRGQSAS